jgi:hypothetical protein
MADTAGRLKGTLQSRLSYFESFNLREQLRSKGQEACFKTLSKTYAKISNTALLNTDSLELPLGLSCNFEMPLGDDDLLYINPMMGEATAANPFKSQQRLYPVEMPATFDELYTLNMAIPAGYEVDELPKSAVVKFNEDEGLFQYLVGKSDNVIQLRSRIVLRKAYFPPEEYESLRDFFDLIVKKQSEQIVLKKKSKS